MPRVRVEARSRLPEADEGLLHELLREAAVAQDPQPEAVQPRLVAAVEGAQRRLMVTGSGTSEEVGLLGVDVGERGAGELAEHGRAHRNAPGPRRADHRSAGVPRGV